MFDLDLVQYVRLSYQSLEDACDAHAEAAMKLSRLTTMFRTATLAVTGIAAVLATLVAGLRPEWRIASAVAAAAAFGACAAYVGFNQQARIQGHRACSARLWLVCEKYRGLLAEMHEGRIDMPTLRERRNALLQEASAVFEHAAPADRYTFEIARRALRGRSGSPALPPAVPPAPRAAA
jgi:SMODS and SLOG-associating 2TM effector domain family 4